MDWQERNLAIAAQSGFDNKFLSFFRRVALRSGSACARAILNRQSIVIEDVLIDEEFAPYRAIALEAGFRAVQSTPLVSTSGALVGVLSTHFSARHTPTDNDMRAMTAVARVTANAIIHQRAIGTGDNALKHNGENISERVFQQVNRARDAVERSYELLGRIGRRQSQ